MAITRVLDMTCEGTVTEGTAARICDRVFAFEDPALAAYIDDVVSVPATTTNQSLSLASLGGTAKYLMLQVDGACSITFQATSGNTVFSLQAGGFICMSLVAVTAIYVTNASATAAVSVKRLAAFS